MTNKSKADRLGIRKTVRLNQKTCQDLASLLDLGTWLNETELLRHALSIGLDNLRKKYGTERDC